MSRRKQANPKFLQVDEERVGQEGDSINTSLPINGTTPMKEDDPPTLDDSYTDDYDDEFAPLVIDTEASAPELDSEQNSNSLCINNEDSSSKVHNNNRNSQPNQHVQNGENLHTSSFRKHTGEMNNSEHLEAVQSVMPSLIPENTSAIVSPSLQQPLTPSSHHSSAGSSPPSPLRANIGPRKGKKSLTPHQANALTTTPMPDSEGNFTCPICPEVLGTSHELTKHIRSHNTVTTGATTGNSCTICGKMLSSQSSLDRHMLVHSGERPFKCLVCKMAFTTNGNMHRHMRIHGKDGESGEAKAPTRRRGGQQKRFTPHGELNVPSMIRMRPMEPMHLAQLPGDHDESLPFVMDRFIFNRDTPPTGQGVKRHFDNIDNGNAIAQKFASKRRISYESEGKIVSPSRRPNERMINQEESADIMNGEQELMNRDADPLHCPVCNKSFLCKYGLESHLETHVTFSIGCPPCNLSFRSQRGLDMHKLLVHSKSHESQDRDMVVENGSTTEEKEEDIPVGFHDLDFMEFSVSKFPLAAKSWCEKKPRQNSSQYHDFPCRDCSKSFPCKSALKLHEYSHVPETVTTCPICQCDFEDSHKLHDHMIKHLSDKALADWQKMPDDLVNTKLQENVSKHDFFAYFDLKSQDDVNDRGESISRPVSLEKRQNEDYFAKLGQVYSPKILPQKPVTAHLLKKELESRKENRVPPVNSADSSLLTSSSNSHSHPDFDDLQQFLKANQAAGGVGVLPPGGLGSPYAALMQPSLGLFPSPLSGAGSPVIGQTVSTPIPPHLRMLPANAMNVMHAVSLGVHQQISPSSACSSAAPSPTELDDSGGMATLDSMHDKSRNKHGMFACKYCDMAFTNYRALKGHTRTHLGLSPYKCNLCSYSSADKSTLIRHLRTHNGERPFQCLVCDFAFTTKANCERHVRKKHSKIDKDDIEKNIGYNKFVSSDPTSVLDSSFHSPDTVCKYCGVDFKFFRALKHHLRSHSSCRQKPFLCQKCNIGFSTKANCVRHIQKQHLDVPQNLIEQLIHINEPLLAAANERDLEQFSDTSMDTPHGSACPSPTSNHTHFMPASTPGSIGPSPRPAHSTPARTATPALFPSMHLPIKVEPVDHGCEQPLDFSMKPGGMKELPPPIVEKAKSSPKSADSTDELPMDLTVKKKPDIEVSKVAPKAAPALFSNVQTYQCQYCPMGFSNQAVLERHQRSRHYQQYQNLLNKTAPAMFHANSGSGSDSSCELASVNRMLDVTDPHKFQAFFQVPESLVESSPVKLLPNGPNQKQDGSSVHPSFQYSISEQELELEERHQIEKTSDEKLSPSGSVDENFNKKSFDPNEAKSKWGQSLTSQHKFRFPEEDVGNSSFENEMDSNVEIKEELSDELSLDSSADCQKVDADGMIVQKKKRNSYADSPHKLHCPYCPRTFPWVSSLTRHLLTHTGQKPFKCPRCPVTFSTKSNRERHLIRKHGVNMLDPASRQTMDRPFKCHLCIFSSFSTKSNLLKHYHDRHQGSAVPETILRGEYPTPHHMDQYDMEMAELEEAQMMENASDVTSEPELEDPTKYDDEVAKVELMMHDKLPEPSHTLPLSNRPLNPERDNYNVDKITECWKCNSKFLSRKLLVRHLKEHNIDFPFKCYLCDASFESRIECLGHQERNHIEDWVQLREKNKVVDIENFSRLMEEIVEKNYKGLDIDGNGHADALDDAEEARLDAATSDYIQRKVYCSLCPKRFWSLQDLRRHMRSHTGEKPFECDMCQKRFTLKHSMMRHRKKHFELPDSISASDDEESVHHEDPGSKDERKSLVIESVLNRLRANQEHLVANIQEKETRGCNGDLSSRKRLAYLQEKRSPMRKDSGFTLDPFGGRDILQSLLGVEDAAIDEMLESADSAAERLGVK